VLTPLQVASTLRKALAQALPALRWLAVEDTLPQEASDEPPCEYMPSEWEEWAQPHDLCHVIFTSGSTGQPKGVQVCASTSWLSVGCSLDSELVVMGL
jgi:long-subunit acyl-CoA synthetase (AMP-forming)